MDKIDKIVATVLIVFLLFMVFVVVGSVYSNGIAAQKIIFERTGEHVPFFVAVGYPDSYFTGISGEIKLK
jgi:hypothetical protein